MSASSAEEVCSSSSFVTHYQRFNGSATSPAAPFGGAERETMYIDFKSVRRWELALSPREEERYSAITFRSGAIYRVKIGAYALTFSRDIKGSRIFTLLCEGEISEQTRIPLGAPLGDYTEALAIFAQWGEETEWSVELESEERRAIFTGDYPSA